MTSEFQDDLHAKRVEVFKALAHSSRLFIVLRLARGDACVGDLTREIGADISTVSKHLAILRDAGLVSDRREGQNIFYSLGCACIVDFLHCIDAVIPPAGDGSRRRSACGIAASPRAESMHDDPAPRPGHPSSGSPRRRRFIDKEEAPREDGEE